MATGWGLYLPTWPSSPVATVMLTVLLNLLAQSLSSDEQGQSQPNASLTPLQFAQGFTGADSCGRAAGFRQLSSGGRQSSSQVSICGFVVFVCGGGENRVIH